MSDAMPAKPGAILREAAAYLRRPRLIAPSGLRAPGAWRQLAVLFLLQAAVLLGVILPLMMLWQKAFGLAGPDAFDRVPEGWFLPSAVLIAPAAEELFFRGWLTGRKRALWLFSCAVAVAALLYGSTQGIPAVAVGAGFLAIVIAAPAGWFLLRRKVEPPRWFAGAFPAIFYLVVLGFALLHLSNYSGFSLLALPLVLPQLWIGTVLGYVRMRIGLMAAIIAHVASNGSVILLTALSS